MNQINFIPYKNQVFERLREQHLRSRTLFEDPEFHASDRSIYRCHHPSTVPSQVYWKRPHELSNIRNPKFSVDGVSANDINQGAIGDCWFLAAAVTIAHMKNYLNIVVPEDQSFDRNYCGIFHFRFWRFGEWYDVVVDDRLPVDEYDRLVFCSNTKCPNELWCSLFEKAYAKLATCYEFLVDGLAQDALVDMTGGVPEFFGPDFFEKLDAPERLWEFLFKANKMKSVSGASITGGTEQPAAFGLKTGHAYSITNVVEIEPGSKHYNMFQSVCSRSATTHRPQKYPKHIQPLRSDYTYDYNNVYTDRYDEYAKYEDYGQEAYGQQRNNADPYDYGYSGNDNGRESEYGGNDYYGGKNEYGGSDYYGHDDGSGYSAEVDNYVKPNTPRKKFQNADNKVRLLRLRNPWGKCEWEGSWSDNSAEWKSIDDNTKRELGIVNSEDGEFWMSFDDFINYFNILDFVHTNLHAFYDEERDKGTTKQLKWYCTKYDGEWLPGENAGGNGQSDRALFWTNPQHLVTVRPTPGTRDSKATLIISLMHKGSNNLRKTNYGKFTEFPKQFRVYRVLDQYVSKSRGLKYSSNQLERIEAELNNPYSELRECSMRFRLDPATYVIIPSTYDKNVPGKYLLRVFTEEFINERDISNLDENNPDDFNNTSDRNFNYIEDILYDKQGKAIPSEDFSDIMKKLLDISGSFENDPFGGQPAPNDPYGNQVDPFNALIDNFANHNLSDNEYAQDNSFNLPNPKDFIKKQMNKYLNIDDYYKKRFKNVHKIRHFGQEKTSNLDVYSNAMPQYQMPFEQASAYTSQSSPYPSNIFAGIGFPNPDIPANFNNQYSQSGYNNNNGAANPGNCRTM